MADICKIYKIINLINGKLYIGQTWQELSKRLSQHRHGTACIKLSNAMVKYGKNNFAIELITIAHTQIIADYWEHYFIEQFGAIKNGYNLKEGGSHGKHSTETIKKMSELKLNLSDEARKNMSEAHIGYIMPEEQKRKISQANMGHIVSAETAKKISETQMGKTISLDIRDKISKTLTGRKIGPRTEEIKIKISESNKGQKRSVETRTKLSLSHKGQNLGGTTVNKGQTWQLINGKRVWINKEVEK